MIKKLILGIITLLVFQTTFSQGQLGNGEKPDFADIERTVKDKNSPYFYAKLMERYKNNDTLLTTKEYRYLYYGFSMQDDYSAYGRSPLKEELKKSIEANDAAKVIELEKKILEKFPFNLRDLNTLADALYSRGDSIEAEIYYNKLVGVGKAMISTGDGQSDSTAMYVISVDHEYDMISMLGYEFGGAQSLVHPNGESVDKMKLKKNEDNIEYLYFNVDRLFASMKKALKD